MAIPPVMRKIATRLPLFFTCCDAFSYSYHAMIASYRFALTPINDPRISYDEVAASASDQNQRMSVNSPDGTAPSGSSVSGQSVNVDLLIAQC